MLGFGALGEFALGEVPLEETPTVLYDDADSSKRRKKRNKEQELAFDLEAKGRADLRAQVTDLLKPKVEAKTEASVETIKEAAPLVPASTPEIAAKRRDSEDEILALLIAVL